MNSLYFASMCKVSRSYAADIKPYVTSSKTEFFISDLDTSIKNTTFGKTKGYTDLYKKYPFLAAKGGTGFFDLFPIKNFWPPGNTWSEKIAEYLVGGKWALDDLVLYKIVGDIDSQDQFENLLYLSYYLYSFDLLISKRILDTLSDPEYIKSSELPKESLMNFVSGSGEWLRNSMKYVCSKYPTNLKITLSSGTADPNLILITPGKNKHFKLSSDKDFEVYIKFLINLASRKHLRSENPTSNLDQRKNYLSPSNK